MFINGTFLIFINIKGVGGGDICSQPLTFDILRICKNISYELNLFRDNMTSISDVRKILFLKNTIMFQLLRKENKLFSWAIYFFIPNITY